MGESGGSGCSTTSGPLGVALIAASFATARSAAGGGSSTAAAFSAVSTDGAGSSRPNPNQPNATAAPPPSAHSTFLLSGRVEGAGDACGVNLMRMTNRPADGFSLQDVV